MTTTPVLHPASVAALVKAAEAHECAAAALISRQPAAAERHTDAARALRAKVGIG